VSFVIKDRFASLKAERQKQDIETTS